MGGSESVHFIGIFPEDADVGRIWTILQAKLEIMPQDVALKSDHRIYVPFVRGAEVIHELGGIVSVHAGKRSNSIEAVRNNSDYKMAFKQDLAHDHVDIFEIGDIADLAPYRSLVFRSVGARLPLVMGSDNHDIKSYTRKVPCWVKADCTFSGLCHVLHEPDDRVHLGDLPASVKRVQGSKTKYIQSVAVRKVADSPLPENWFGGEVPLNSGFVAIIGNKGGARAPWPTSSPCSQTRRRATTFLSCAAKNSASPGPTRRPISRPRSPGSAAGRHGVSCPTTWTAPRSRP